MSRDPRGHLEAPECLLTTDKGWVHSQFTLTAPWGALALGSAVTRTVHYVVKGSWTGYNLAKVTVSAVKAPGGFESSVKAELKVLAICVKN